MMNTDKLMNPDADQPQSQQEKKEKKKKKNPVQPRSKPIHRRNPTQFNPDQNPYTAEKEKPSSTTKKQKPTHRRSTPITTGKTKKTQNNTQTPPPLDQCFLHRRSTQINHQNPTGPKTQTSPINPNHNRKKKKKKNPDQPRSKPRHRRR